MDAEFRARPAASSEELLADSAQRAKQVKVCDVCRGMRSLQHEYNNRVMERMCERCDGEGVLANGKPIGPPSGAPQAPPPNPNPFQPGNGAKMRLAVLTRDERRGGRARSKGSYSISKMPLCMTPWKISMFRYYHVS
jgi:hypothetical protein